MNNIKLTRKELKKREVRKNNKMMRSLRGKLSQDYRVKVGNGYANVAKFLLDKKLATYPRYDITRTEAKRIIIGYIAGEKRIKPLHKTAKQHKATKSYAAQSKEFLSSWEWRTLRYEVLQKHGRRCMCCGAMPDDGVTVICVDHIKPRHTHPDLALDPANLQVLCGVCNQGKGAWDTTDFRDNVIEYDFQCELANKANDSQ